MKRKYTKYKSLGSFSSERKAQDKLDYFENQCSGEGRTFRLFKRVFSGKDKTRYTIQELIRKGAKR
tara:strand:- start:927 stop:1124 length:198 start_codon:yes stop_codon:yes gene_type:complete